jgi:hypothetical protein
MNNQFIFILTINLIINLSFKLQAQGVIVNEISNGVDSIKEYIELVVVGSNANPTGTVDLSGWIFDDNNGHFEALGAGTGIANGHGRFSINCLKSVKPGSIILIYNNAQTYTNIPTGSSDQHDSNDDCIYIFRITDSCIQINTSLPSTANSSYTPATYVLGNWLNIGMRNDGDAIQVRNPSGVFQHGFSYGDVNTVFPVFPNGNSSFNVIAGTGTARNYFFNSGNYTISGNYSRGSAFFNETPGSPNNNQNRYFINRLRDGTYDYNNLNNIINIGSESVLLNCDIILNNNLIYFNVNKIDDHALLQFKVSDNSYKYIQVEKSNDAINFTPKEIISVDTNDDYFYIDNKLDIDNYYRLKMINDDDSYDYSNILYLSHSISDDIIIFPNPIINSELNIKYKDISSIVDISIYNNIGQLVYYNNNVSNKMNIDNLSSGIYTISINLGYIKIHKILLI